MKILVLNSGSTSLKYKLFSLPNLNTESEGNLQNIANHEEALKQALRKIGDLRDIAAIGHRVVHGGPVFKKPVKITKSVLKKLEQYNYLAPLHNPANLAGIRACQKYLPEIPNIACFDTAFFSNLPDQAKIYPLPFSFYREQKIQRFGFHGLSHQSAMISAAKKLKKPLSEIKIITAHLGGGASISAIAGGKPIDTSMGFTPLEGLMMMTRAGDLDPGIILHLAREYPSEKLDHLLNHQSGILGLSGCSNYLRFLSAVKKEKPKACLAFNIFIYRVQKYIGAYFAVLGGIDALVFTGQIGAGKMITRQAICAGLKKILTGVKIIVVKTDEEKMIAEEIREELRI
ncbi:acetate kinase, partial [bacterium (Candidatus Torokbacteria) CG09_land_8_20_14_0_10_42_11]